MPKLKPGTIVPTPAEDAEINRQIADDPENPEWTDVTAKRAIPFQELPKEMQSALKGLRSRGPQKKPTKTMIGLRLDPEVLDLFRATGAGYQSRMNRALKDWLKDHDPAKV